MNDGVIRRPAIRASIDPRQMKRYRLEARVLRVALAVFRIIGLDAASALGGFIGRTIGPRTGRSRPATNNIRAAFPDMGDDEVAGMVIRMWDNLGRTVAEYSHIDKFRPYSAGGRMEIGGTEYIDRAVAAGKSIIFVSGHFCNWELLPICVAQYGLRVGQVYRAPNNLFVHDWLAGMRARFVTPVQIAKGQDGARGMINQLAQGGHLAMMVDQKLNYGISVPFLGREAMTSSAAARLALKYDCAILPTSMERLGSARFRVRFHPAVELARTDDRTVDIATTTRRLNDILGEWIRARPDEWLWIHNRWPK